MKFFKNIILLSVVLSLSYFTATCFGNWYNNFSNLDDGSMLGLGDQALEFIAGFPFAYIFFVTFLFKLFGSGNKKKWIVWLLIPAALFFGSGDLKHIYLPIILGLIGFGLAKVILIIWGKFKENKN